MTKADVTCCTASIIILLLPLAVTAKESLVSRGQRRTVPVLEARYVMSGRSAPNRGKKGHRRYESADSSRQSSSNHSGKYGGKEPPPRFLSRPRNGDGRSNINSGGDSYDDYSGGRKEGGGHRGSGGRQGTAAGSPSGGGRSSNFGKTVAGAAADRECMHYPTDGCCCLVTC